MSFASSWTSNIPRWNPNIMRVNRVKMPPEDGDGRDAAGNDGDRCPPEIARLFRGVRTLFRRVLADSWKHRALGHYAPTREEKAALRFVL